MPHTILQNSVPCGVHPPLSLLHAQSAARRARAEELVQDVAVSFGISRAPPGQPHVDDALVDLASVRMLTGLIMVVALFAGLVATRIALAPCLEAAALISFAGPFAAAVHNTLPTNLRGRLQQSSQTSPQTSERNWLLSPRWRLHRPIPSDSFKFLPHLLGE